ncbi:hypothetical protein pb186bvf_012989 [Paramecium bursaria]
MQRDNKIDYHRSKNQKKQNHFLDYLKCYQEMDSSVRLLKEQERYSLIDIVNNCSQKFQQRNIIGFKQFAQEQRLDGLNLRWEIIIEQILKEKTKLSRTKMNRYATISNQKRSLRVTTKKNEDPFRMMNTRTIQKYSVILKKIGFIVRLVWQMLEQSKSNVNWSSRISRFQGAEIESECLQLEILSFKKVAYEVIKNMDFYDHNVLATSSNGFVNFDIRNPDCQFRYFNQQDESNKAIFNQSCRDEIIYTIRIIANNQFIYERNLDDIPIDIVKSGTTNEIVCLFQHDVSSKINIYAAIIPKFKQINEIQVPNFSMNKLILDFRGQCFYGTGNYSFRTWNFTRKRMFNYQRMK